MPDTSFPDPTETATGLILAGGMGRRLGGVDKAALRVGGTTLARLVAQRLAPQCDDLFILGEARHPGSHGLGLLSDSGRGPAQAIIEAVRQLTTTGRPGGLVLTASVDAPLIPANLRQRLFREMIGDVAAVVACHGGRTYPTHTLYRSGALCEIVDSGEDFSNASLFSLLDRMGWRKCDFDPEEDRNPFAGINTPAELLACNRWAMGR